MTKEENKKLRKRKTKRDPKPDPDEESIDAELERKYKVEIFYKFGPVFGRICLAFTGLIWFLYCIWPDLRNPGALVGSSYFVFAFLLIKYFARYKDTKDEEYGMKALQACSLLWALLQEIFMVRTANPVSVEATMVWLALYFLGIIFVRVLLLSRIKRYPIVSCGIHPLLALKYPRYRVFEPHKEALAFFVTNGLGWIGGCIIDEIQWRHFVSLHKYKLELKETRKRAMAYEALACREETFFEIR